VILAACCATLLLVGCTIQEITLYKTVNQPLAAISPSGAIYPKARTP